MLPSLRTILAAMCVTAILVTMVGAALTPIYPRVEQPLADYALAESPMEQLETGHARRAEELKEPPRAESSSQLLSEGEGTSRHTKNLVTARVDPAENEAPGFASASPPEKPTTNSTTQGADTAATGSLNRPSIATSQTPESRGGPAASFAVAAKRMAERCLSCHRGFRSHGIRSGVRRRIPMTPDRFTTP
jgi:hypothetical protein